MKQFINKEDLINKLHELNFDISEELMNVISDLPTVGVESVSTKCGTCNYFERYNNVRGYCNKRKEYHNKSDYCKNWEEGSK